MNSDNLIDRLAGFFSPGWYLSRTRARAMAGMLRSYEAAATGRRTETWLAKNTSANAETQLALSKVRERHRDLNRNNPWAHKALSVVTSVTVGYGITGEIKHPNRKRQERLNEKWKAWAGSTLCDADGQHDLYGLQALGMLAVGEGGEVLVRRRRRRLADGLEVPLQLQLLEGDYLDHSRTEASSSGRIVQGVEFNGIGARTAYWMFREHPGDVLGHASMPVRVPASELTHVYRVDRPGQVRGMPWGVSAYITLRELDGFEDAYLLRQKLANCLMAFIHDGGPSLDAPDKKAAFPETMEPGLIARIPAGKSVTFSDPPSAEGYAGYTGEVLYRVAGAYGISYEALTGNLSRVNFTSGRMGWLQMHGNADRWRWHMLIPRKCEVIGQWFLEALEQKGEDVRGARFVWTPPRREILNPAQEIPAMMRSARAGLQSLPELHRELGMNSNDVLREIAETNKFIDELGLVLDSDPRKVSGAGLTQARPAGTTIPGTDISDGSTTADEESE